MNVASEDMSAKLLVADKPCSSCPYRRDVPRGIWDATEYEKLRGYDDGPKGQQSYATFLCHHTHVIGTNTVCRGWLSVHAESVAVRLLMLRGIVTSEQVYADPLCKLYASGNEAADAGMEGIKYPNSKTLIAIDKLVRSKVATVPHHGYDRKTGDGKTGRKYVTRKGKRKLSK